MYIVNVYIEHPIFKIDQLFSYYTMDDTISVGKRVLVSFNNQNNIIGFVDEVIKTDKTIEEIEHNFGYSIKEIIKIIDDQSLLNEELYNLGKWMALDTISPTISCFQAMLPSYMKPSSNNLTIKKDLMCRKTNNSFDKLTKAQKLLLDKIDKPILVSELRKISASITNKLIDIGALELFEQENFKPNVFELSTNTKKLTNEQQNCFEEIINAKQRVCLLHGVTGSGKTEIYLHLAQEYLNRGKQVIILVPEISLTPMMTKRVSQVFSSKVAIYHSGLSNKEKYNQYKLVLNKEVSIVVGTRSSIFMPFDNLGLIIIDEEHDQSYKQDTSPCYNTKDIAIYRSEYFNAKVLLASATPSLESYARGVKGVYKLISLNNRINNQLPQIEVVNMQECMKNSGNYIISNVLKDEITSTLSNNLQAIILLNRRGYSSIYKCSSCNETIKCDHCDIAMSYHKKENKLKCHICNSVKDLPKYCPNCHSTHFSSFGFGTQKVEETLQTMFPNSRIQRMDNDTISKKNSHHKILTMFENHEFDILVGTQMIAKGLDFPLVNLVGIINGDAGLNRMDFRSVETTFDLIVQASGRSGRSNNKGKVVLQVFNDDHYAIKNAINNNYIGFFKDEMKYRFNGQYPPYTYLIAIYIQDLNDNKALRSVSILQDLLQNSNFKVLGPSKLLKLSDMNRYRFILKGKDLNGMKEEVRDNIKRYFKEKLVASIKVDVNPLYLE